MIITDQDITTNAFVFKETLKNKRRGMSDKAKKRTKRFKSRNRWLFPTAIERKYAKELRALQKRVITFYETDIANNLDRWIAEFRNDGVKLDDLEMIEFEEDGITIKLDSLDLIEVDELKQDAYPQDLVVSAKDAKAVINQIYEVEGNQVRLMISNTGFAVSDQNLKQFQKFTKELVGIDYVPIEPWETEVVSAWTETNFELSKGLSDEYIKKANTLISEGVQQGKSSASLFKDLKKLGRNISNSRTKLIARDQVGKLNGMLTKRRQTDIGIDTYIWITAGDERVRGKPGGRYPNAIPSHHIMSGKVFKWKNNNVYSDNNGKTWKKRTVKMSKTSPGMEIQCRCTAIPFFDDLIEEVDDILEKEAA